jgi:hypothetical protein
MGLWAAHFHWTVLLRWDVLGWSIGILLAVGGLMLTFDQYTGANVCFVIVAALILTKATAATIAAPDPPLGRILFTFLIFGIVGVGIVETVRGVNHWRSTRQTSQSQPPPRNIYHVPLSDRVDASDGVNAKKSRAPQQSLTGKKNGQVGGGVTAGPCSNVQIGGSNNQATTNCVPPPPPARTLSNTDLEKLRKALTVNIVPKPKVAVKSVGADTDMPAFPNQVTQAFSGGGWDVIPIWSGSSGVLVLKNGSAIAPSQDGLHCAFRDADADRPEVKQVLQAFKNAHLPCERTDDSPEGGALLMVIIGPKMYPH